MPHPFKEAVSTIKRYLEHWVPGISVVERFGSDTATIDVRIESKQVHLRYGPELDDLARALTDSQLPAPYKNGVIRDYTLGALVTVGKNGMAPNLDVSKLVLEEKLDWNLRVRLRTLFDAETAKRLYSGLKILDAVAKELTDGDSLVPEIEKEREVMGAIIGHYERTGNLNDWEVTGESLSYLKGAALPWILELETQKRETSSPRVRAVQSARLFEILEAFWLLQPWNRIPLPPIVRDYLAQRGEPGKGVATGPGPGIDLGPQLKKFDPRLEERWRGAWEALRSKNPDKVSQAANSMVEVLDKVIDGVCAGREFKDVLAERYPEQEKVVLAKRAYISALKSGLQTVKHETSQQSVDTAQDLMHAAEGIIRTLLR